MGQPLTAKNDIRGRDLSHALAQRRHEPPRARKGEAGSCHALKVAADHIEGSCRPSQPHILLRKVANPVPAKAQARSEEQRVHGTLVQHHDRI